MKEFKRIIRKIEDTGGRLDCRKQLELTELALEIALLNLSTEDVRNVCADVLRYQRSEWQARERMNEASREAYRQRQEEMA